jgi:ParB-like chromosome segregation protein Spo0J
MTDTTPAPLSDDERAELDKLRAAQAAQAVPYDEAAAAVGAAVDQGPQADAGASLGQMSTAPAEPLPHEATMDAMMAEFKAMSARVQAMEQELGQARGDYAAAAAALGPPSVALYAKAIHDKLTSFRAAHPDAPAGHFDAVIAKAAPLAEAAADLINGKPGAHASAVTDQLAGVVDAVERFTGRTHPRKWGKPIDFSALEGDLEDAQAAADAATSRAS